MKRKQTFIIIGILLFFTISTTYSQVDENVFRVDSSKKELKEENLAQIMDVQLDFNADWHFHLGETPGFHVPEFDDSEWRVLDVPHDWSIEGQFDKDNPSSVSGAYLPTGIGCYR